MTITEAATELVNSIPLSQDRNIIGLSVSDTEIILHVNIVTLNYPKTYNGFPVILRQMISKKIE